MSVSYDMIGSAAKLLDIDYAELEELLKNHVVHETPSLLIRAAAEQAQVHPATIRRWIRAGRLRSWMVVGRVRVAQSDLDNLLAGNANN